MMEKEFMTVTEVAGYFGVTKKTVYNWVYQCRIPFYKPFGRVLFRKSDVMKIILDARVASIDELNGN